MSNKELIEELRSRLRFHGSVGNSVDFRSCERAIKALQDAEAEAKKQAATHLHEESKLLEEINRLKADNAKLKLNNNILQVEFNLAEEELYEAEDEMNRLKVEQVDRLEMIRHGYFFGSKGKIITYKEAEQILEQFKKERE